MNKTKNEVRVSGKTIDLALASAAKELNVSLERIEHRIVSQTRGGFLAFFGRRVEIVANIKDGATAKPNWKGRRNAPADLALTSQDESEKEAFTEQQIADLILDLKTFCQGIVKGMVGPNVDVTATLSGDRLILNICDVELAAVVAKNLKIAESLEHVLRKKPRYLKRELPFRIFVDVNSFRQNREDELIEMAKDLSSKVSDNKRPIVLNYKSSYDRKIIHMALDKDERVYTKSIGSGPNRKLMILPFKEAEHDKTN